MCVCVCVCVCWCRHVLSKCRQLSELSVDLSEAVDVDSLFAVSQHSLQLQVLRLYDVMDPGLTLNMHTASTTN